MAVPLVFTTEVAAIAGRACANPAQAFVAPAKNAAAAAFEHFSAVTAPGRRPSLSNAAHR